MCLKAACLPSLPLPLLGCIASFLLFCPRGLALRTLSNLEEVKFVTNGHISSEFTDSPSYICKNTH